MGRAGDRQTRRQLSLQRTSLARRGLLNACPEKTRPTIRTPPTPKMSVAPSLTQPFFFDAVNRNSANAVLTSARSASASIVHERRYAETVSPASAAR